MKSRKEMQMLLNVIRFLYRYNKWANQCVLDTAAKLLPEQLVATHSVSFQSVHTTLVHTMSGQWIWLSRWKRTSPEAMLDPAAYPSLGSIRNRWNEIESETAGFVDALSTARLHEVVAYKNTRGEAWAYPLWQQMIHQVNHATQHRSEVALMLTQFGYSPGDLDILVYQDELNEETG